LKLFKYEPRIFVNIVGANRSIVNYDEFLCCVHHTKLYPRYSNAIYAVCSTKQAGRKFIFLAFDESVFYEDL